VAVVLTAFLWPRRQPAAAVTSPSPVPAKEQS
jgi:hypothetical protein